MSLFVIFLIVAFISFVIAALNLLPNSHVNWDSAGFAFVVLAFILQNTHL
jgi:hypothetical protein